MSTVPAMTQEEMDEFIDEVKIECTGQVYFAWNDETHEWYVDSPTVDHCPLDVSDAGVYSDYGPRENLPEQKQAEWDRAERTPLPTGQELIGLLQEAAAWRKQIDGMQP